MNTYPAYLLGLEGAKDKDAIVAHVDTYIKQRHADKARIAELEAELAKSEQYRANLADGQIELRERIRELEARCAALLSDVNQDEGYERLKARCRDYEEVLADHRRLVRELDALLNGLDAAPQASLCDIVSQVRSELLRQTQSETSSKHPPRPPCEWKYDGYASALADCPNCGLPIGQHVLVYPCSEPNRSSKP